MGQINQRNTFRSQFGKCGVTKFKISISISFIGSKNNTIFIANARTRKKNIEKYYLQVKTEQRYDGGVTSIAYNYSLL